MKTHKRTSDIKWNVTHAINIFKETCIQISMEYFIEYL